MDYNDLNRSVAQATGETVTTIRQRGFSFLHPEKVLQGPHVIDWDTSDFNSLPYCRVDELTDSPLLDCH